MNVCFKIHGSKAPKHLETQFSEYVGKALNSKPCNGIITFVKPA